MIRILIILSVTSAGGLFFYFMKPEPTLFACFDGKNTSAGLSHPILGQDCFEDVR